MPMRYPHTAIDESLVPRAATALFQHLIDTYASETNKVVSVWSGFTDQHLDWRAHPRSSSLREILKHQLLSERRFFGEFLGVPEPSAATVLPDEETLRAYEERFIELARPHLEFFAARNADWWQHRVSFFDVERERIWIFWRRILHTAHHRTQLTVYLRLLNLPVPAIYGPTADFTWDGADPTHTIEAAARQ